MAWMTPDIQAGTATKVFGYADVPRRSPSHESSYGFLIKIIEVVNSIPLIFNSGFIHLISSGNIQSLRDTLGNLYMQENVSHNGTQFCC